MFALLVAVYIIILWSEVPSLLKRRWYKELVVFTVVFLFSVYMGMVQFYHWPFYNPMDFVLARGYNYVH